MLKSAVRLFDAIAGTPADIRKMQDLLGLGEGRRPTHGSGGQSMTTDQRPKRWYVTASHRRLDRSHAVPIEVPYGTSHVREVGASVTACGKPTFGWPIFWDTECDDLDDICRECRWTARIDAIGADRPGETQ